MLFVGGAQQHGVHQQADKLGAVVGGGVGQGLRS